LSNLSLISMADLKTGGKSWMRDRCSSNPSDWYRRTRGLQFVPCTRIASAAHLFVSTREARERDEFAFIDRERTVLQL
jgi:hypothetical protein